MARAAGSSRALFSAVNLAGLFAIRIYAKITLCGPDLPRKAQPGKQPRSHLVESK